MSETQPWPPHYGQYLEVRMDGFRILKALSNAKHSVDLHTMASTWKSGWMDSEY